MDTRVKPAYYELEEARLPASNVDRPNQHHEQPVATFSR
jgi:hypothetical protein